MGSSSRHTALTLAVGPILAVAVGGLTLAVGLPWPAVITAAITGLCAAWWVAEPIPIPATSLIPLAALPLLGVIDQKQAAAAYGHPVILLLLGGFLLSTAMERSGAHRRVALSMVRFVGGRDQRRLVLGFMLAAAALSMWISNTASTLMLLPVVLAVADQARDGGMDGDGGEPLTVALLLGLAYAASIGGLGTPIGTPPNAIFIGMYGEQTGVAISFAAWMRIGVPAVILLLPIAWFVLTRRLPRGRPLELPEVGPWRPEEVRVLAVFALTALAWMTREAPFGGWVGLAGLVDGAGKAMAGDGTVALAAVVICFLVPNGRGERLLDWETAVKIPWGVLILFGGGLAIAKGFEVSGLSAALGDGLSGILRLPTVLLIAIVCLLVTFLTEVTSNTASTTLLMPILAAAGIAAGIDPIVIMAPAALSASCAFMLPVATAPNAIVFGTGRVTLRRMAREGLAINLLGAAAITALSAFLFG